MGLEEIAKQQERNRQRAEAESRARKEREVFEAAFIRDVIPEIQRRVSEGLTQRGVVSHWPAPDLIDGRYYLEFPHAGQALSIGFINLVSAVTVAEDLQSSIVFDEMSFPLLTIFLKVRVFDIIWRAYNYPSGVDYRFIWRGDGDTARIADRLMEILSGGRPKDDWENPPKPKKEGACFIASAVYGLHAIEVETLRTFRDLHLTPYRFGRLGVSLYYQYSPPIAELARKHSSLNTILRVALHPFVRFASYTNARSRRHGCGNAIATEEEDLGGCS